MPNRLRSLTGMETTMTQRRAKAGGEYGANGDWYEGGKFIATEEYTIKRAPMHHEVTPEEAARRAARDEENRILAARVQAWLTERRARFADTLAVLLAKPYGKTADEWAWLLANGQGGFHASLGVQLRDGGSLSARQAEYVANAIFGRCNRKNAEAWDALVSGLAEDFK